MNDSESVPKQGEFVKILRGKDANHYSVVVEIIDDRFVRIADGVRRKFDRAKKNNIHHLERLGVVSPEVARSLRETGRVTNGKLRFALAKFLQEEASQRKKGD